MARTWTLHQAITVGGAPIRYKQFAQDSDYTKVYIATTGGTVYSYDGLSEVDIAGATFAGTDILGICNFKDDIYIAYNTGGVARVARYNGGTSWTAVYSPANEVIIDYGGITNNRVLAADGERMVLAIAQTAPPLESRLMGTTDGTTWTAQTVASVTISAIGSIQNLGSPGDGNNGGELLAQYGGATLKTIRHNAGNDWTALTATGYPLNDGHLLGYFDGKSFYDERNGLTYELRSSTDWGDSLSGTGAPTAGTVGLYLHFLTYIADDAMMMFIGGSNTAYTWNSGSNQFDADGTTGTEIHGFFRLGSKIYAICDPGSEDMDIYDGGTVIVPGSVELRFLGLAADSSYLYVTANEGGELKLLVFDLDSLAQMGETDFGAVTYAELDSRTYLLRPLSGAYGALYLWGRDGNDVKVQQSDDAGASFASLDDGGWAADKVVVGLHFDPLNTPDFTAAFADDDIYRSLDGGAAWTKTADAPVTLRAVSRHPIDECDMILAGQAAGVGELHWTPNYGQTAVDVSEGTMGVVNVIEVSR